MSARGALAAAIALVALVALGGCRAGDDAAAFTIRAGAALRPAPAPPPLAAPAVRALHLADFGDRTRQQAAVAVAHRRAPFDLALFPGDNLYDCGPDARLPGAASCVFAPDGNAVAPGFAPPADRTFARHEEPLAPLAAAPHPAQVWLALGNHDVAPCGGGASIQRLKACLEVAHASPTWAMPGRHYVVDEGPARFVFVDSNLLGGDYGGFSFDDEVAFVARAAAGCGERLCFVVGHQPPALAGTHRDEPRQALQAARTARLLAAGRGRIRAWLGGHDHDLQHLRTAEGLDVLVSGNGARARPGERFEVASPGASLLFASGRWGYGVLEVGSDGWRYRFEGGDGAPLYCCAATRTGPCEPVSCAAAPRPPSGP
ncbi:metallophosphoesterase [Anaeromyxobacter oryzisoli]|uniref:metallophosphoesterase n=1 Tax=Anaeromyxobacter oryzisoli TaxID=2925408 RepID=UPI001F58BC97|nr:metallophosphoesterase [Anaeromyxobacter sp. SG63]